MNLFHLKFFKQLNMAKLPPLVFRDVQDTINRFQTIHVLPAKNQDPRIIFRYADQKPICVDLLFHDQTISIYAISATNYRHLHPIAQHLHPLSKQLAVQTNWQDSQTTIFNYIKNNYHETV